MFRRSLLLLLPLAACSGDAPSAQIDAAAPGGDAAVAVASVKQVACPAGAVPTVDAQNAANAFTPKDSTVAVNGIVKFTMGTEHDVVPNTITSTDTGLNVAFGATTCLQFTKAGTFGFACGTHGFAGTITVQ